MLETGAVVGIDTSNYTTSIAAVDLQGEVLFDERKPLPVAQGRRGLRQSEALFGHLQALPGLVEALAAHLRARGGAFPVRAVGASTRPRPVEGSYMPVFRAGEGFGRALAAAWSVPFLPCSHQEGHLMAALPAPGTWMAQRRPWMASSEPFLALHLSGGTTELVEVTPGPAGPQGSQAPFRIRALGSTADISAGQLIDRVGVALGLPFPAGPALERLAQRVRKPARLPVAALDLQVSFSGPEAAARRALEGGEDPAALALGVLECVAQSVLTLVHQGLEASRARRVLAFGGVMANGHIRRRLAEGLERLGVPLVVAPVALSGDNAVGAARWALLASGLLQQRLGV